MTLAADLAQISTDADKFHDMVHGDLNTTVSTDGGTVPSVAKTLASINAGNARGAWLTATSYAPNDVVTESGYAYRCLLAHTSGTFATDLAAAKWLIAPATGTIPDGSVTEPKIVSDAVTTAKILNNAVTNAKLAQMATATFKGRATAGTGNAEDLTAAQAAALLVPSLFIGQRNRIINGCFRKWDYATSQTSSGYGSANRFYNFHNGTTKTTSRQAFTVGQTDVPGEPQYFMRTVVTSSAGAGNYCGWYHHVESSRTFAGKTASLSFYAKADSAKNIAIEFIQNFGSGGSPSAGFTGIGVTTCALTTSWKKFTVTVNIPSISGKTLGTTDDGSFTVACWLDAGSSLNARTNSLGQQSGTFDIARVRICEGSVDCDNDPDVTLDILDIQCARYLPVAQSESPYGAIPGSGVAYSTTQAFISIPFSTRARTAPTGITVSGVADFRLADGASPVVTSALAFSSATKDACFVLMSVASGLTQWRPYLPQAANVTTAKILFTGCEL